jgi:hypothetical protein
MRTCCKCGANFKATGNNYRCSPCRKQYNAEWRVKRKLEGKSGSGAKMPRDYHRAYEAAYFSKDENRARRNALMRSYAKSPDLRPRHEARWLVRRAINSGRLNRKPCEVCGETKSHAHHDDYSRPLDVRWLCPTHHREHHAKTKAEGRS